MKVCRCPEEVDGRRCWGKSEHQSESREAVHIAGVRENSILLLQRAGGRELLLDGARCKKLRPRPRTVSHVDSFKVLAWDGT